MTNPQPSKTAKSPDRVSTPTPSGAAAIAEPLTAQKQLAVFEGAMKLFHARRLAEARTAFVQAANGPQRDIAQRAGLHVRMCDRRLGESAPPPVSAEDHYNYGVALINSRNVPAALEHVRKALEMAPEAGHVHYAVALAEALSGNLERAAYHLGRAIELEPHNRVAARQDADFAPFLNQPPLDAVLFPERRGWPGQ